MLTIFSVPKPFTGDTAHRQSNAIRSWQSLEPQPEIILCGDHPSITKTASELGVTSLGNIECSTYGTPLLNSVFSKVHGIASFPILCYVNTDIIFFQDLVDAVRRIDFAQFLAVGQRTDLDLAGQMNYANPNWHYELRALVQTSGQLHSTFGIDYFIFTASSGFHNIPPFIVGRPRWDNWFIFNARKKGIPVVDLTRGNLVIHQNHDYAHIPNWKGVNWSGPETDHNSQLYYRLIGDYIYHCNIKDATHILTHQGLIPARSKDYLFSRLQTTSMFKPRLRPLAKLLRDLYRKKERS